MVLNSAVQKLYIYQLNVWMAQFSGLNVQSRKGQICFYKFIVLIGDKILSKYHANNITF